MCGCTGITHADLCWNIILKCYSFFNYYIYNLSISGYKHYNNTTVALTLLEMALSGLQVIGNTGDAWFDRPRM